MRVGIYAPRAGTLRWVLEELGDDHEAVVLPDAAALAGVLGASDGDIEVLVIDFEALGFGELLDVRLLGRRYWRGVVIALGRVTSEDAAAFAIELVVPRPFGSEALRAAVDRVEDVLDFTLDRAS